MSRSSRPGRPLDREAERLVHARDPVLRRRARHVQDVTEATVELIEALFEVMYRKGGVGLAAPQIGEDVAVVVIDPRPGDPHGKPQALLNPAIVQKHGQATAPEGCLSLPGVSVMVSRATRIRVRALEVPGVPVEFEVEGLVARIIQHEVDHLHGRLIMDYLGWRERRHIRNSLKEQQ